MADKSYSEFVNSVQEYLRSGDTIQALAVFSDKNNSTEIQNSSWDLIPVITEFLTSDTEKNNCDLFKCCRILIDIVANICNPEEALLQFIEEIEECEDNIKFLALLQPIQINLFRVPRKHLHSLAWTLNAIQTFMRKIELPEYDVRIKERLLYEANVQKVLLLYSELLIFYETFYKELEDSTYDGKDKIAVLRKFLIQSLERPLIHLDMEMFNNVEGKARKIIESIVSMISKTTVDYIDIIEQNKRENNELIRPDTSGVAALYYFVYSEGVYLDNFPSVYSPIYFFQNSLYLATNLLEFECNLVIEKGLKLTLMLLAKVKYLELSYLLLESENHCKFCMALSKVIIYNQIEYIRKSALEIYKLYLTSFEKHGFYLLVYNLISTLNHSGLIGFTITMYKDQLALELLHDENNLSNYFRGDKLKQLLQKFCFLPKGEESDLIEQSEKILATLNILRYLALKDKDNVTQIWNYFSSLEKGYLYRLKKGIELSKAHYDLKIKELQEEKASGDGNKPAVEVSVGAQNLLSMSKSEKLHVLNSALTAFDVMDSVLCRLVECIQLKKH